jgi:hypothetical protein
MTKGEMRREVERLIKTGKMPTLEELNGQTSLDDVLDFYDVQAGFLRVRCAGLRRSWLYSSSPESC